MKKYYILIAICITGQAVGDNFLPEIDQPIEFEMRETKEAISGDTPHTLSGGKFYISHSPYNTAGYLGADFKKSVPLYSHSPYHHHARALNDRDFTRTSLYKQPWRMHRVL